MEKYLIKALDMLSSFAKCDDRKIKMKICEYEIIEILIIFLNSF